jgi:hypothetical protein
MALLNQAKKNGIAKPFIYVDIGKFLPSWAMEVPSHSMCVHAFGCTVSLKWCRQWRVWQWKMKKEVSGRPLRQGLVRPFPFIIHVSVHLDRRGGWI